MPGVDIASKTLYTAMIQSTLLARIHDKVHDPNSPFTPAHMDAAINTAREFASDLPYTARSIVYAAIRRYSIDTDSDLQNQ